MAKRPTRSTAKGMLSLIDKFLSDPNIPFEETEKLWDILAALRGPDRGTMDEKYATTSIIRKTALPNSFSREYSDGLFTGSKGTSKALGAEDSQERVVLRQKMSEDRSTTSWHFMTKVEDAFRALGLKWEEKN